MVLKELGAQVSIYKSTTIQPIIIRFSDFLGPVTFMPGRSYADVTLYFDNVTMTGLDQVLYVDLVLTDVGSGVNINSTQSTIVIEPIGELYMIALYILVMESMHQLLW